MTMVAESRRSRRLIGRLDRGSDIVDGLLEVCRSHHVRTGELRAVGALESVTLDEYDQRGRAFRPPRRFDAPLEIVHLTGNVSERDGKPFVMAYCALSRQRDNGIELLGGRVVAGRVFAVEFVIESFDDLILRRGTDAATGLPLWREAISLEPTPVTPGEEPGPQHPPFEAPARVDWSDVVAASVARATPSDEQTATAGLSVTGPDDGATATAGASDAKPAPGDFIDHPKFGRCQVERIEGDYEFVSARLRNQRLIRLSLDVLTLIPVGREGEHMLFRAEAGR